VEGRSGPWQVPQRLVAWERHPLDVPEELRRRSAAPAGELPGRPDAFQLPGGPGQQCSCERVRLELAAGWDAVRRAVALPGGAEASRPGTGRRSLDRPGHRS